MNNRIHRISNPSFLPEKVSQDVLLKMHYFQVKETVLLALFKKMQLPDCATSILVLPDLAAHTLQRRKNLISLTKALHSHDVGYHWKYPATLKISHDGSTALITTIQEGLRLLKEWKIVPENLPDSAQSNPPTRPSWDWSKTSYKCNDKRKNPRWAIILDRLLHCCKPWVADTPLLLCFKKLNSFFPPFDTQHSCTKFFDEPFFYPYMDQKVYIGYIPMTFTT